MEKALEVAETLKLGSPDAIRASKKGVFISETTASWSEAIKLASGSPETQAMLAGKDMKEGPSAFAMKRKPNWNGYTKL